MGFINLFKIQYKKELKLKEFRYNRYLPKTPNNKKQSGILTKKKQRNKLIFIEVEEDPHSAIPPA